MKNYLKSKCNHTVKQVFFETMINPLRTRSYVLIGKEVGTDSEWMLIRMAPEDSIMILIIRQHFDINLSVLKFVWTPEWLRFLFFGMWGLGGWKKIIINTEKI